MSLFAWECALACGLAIPAQSQPVPTPSPFVAVKTAAANFGVDQPAGARPAVDEEIEVMRRLLLGKIAVAGGGGGQYVDWLALDYRKVPYSYYQEMPDKSVRRSYDWIASGGPAVEGVYVDGYGILFAVTLPAAAANPTAWPNKPASAPAPLSDWEQTRRQLLGETVPAQSAPAPAKQSLSDVLLHLLADNGKHFAHLRDDERLTVAITFRDAGRADDRFFYFKRDAQPGDPAADADFYYKWSLVPDAVPEQKASDLDLLIDLHLKQGQNDQALADIEKALKQLDDRFLQASKEFGPNHPTLVNLAKAMNSLHAKQASALLATGRVDAARDVLAKIRAIDEANAARQANSTPAGVAATSGPRLPAKLTVSATKRQLDLVGAGKMTFEAFSKEAKVEFSPATGAVKPPAGEEKK
jgi:tetratricopeptide (TPR) repeat protein